METFSEEENIAANFSYLPITPAREGVSHLSEVVFLENWQKLAPYQDYHYGGDWQSFLVYICVRAGIKAVKQRHATVTSSFFTWLGTNVGNGFLLELEKVGNEKETYLGSSELEASLLWVKRNTRSYCRATGSRRLINNFLTSDDPNKTLHATLRDVELIEMLCGWLVTKDGKKFITKVREEVKKRTLNFSKK